MPEYEPPVDELLFALRHVADIGALAKLESFANSGLDGVEDLLAEASRFFSEVVVPTNRPGDRVGSRRNPDGSVTTPPGFVDAYRRFVDSGWSTLPFTPEFGGGGLPWLVGTAVSEMFTASNMAFSLCPMLTQGAIHMLSAHGSPDQQAEWLPKLITGEWSATMNLTEPQAGSDVGAVTTRAEPAGDGTYRISGQKIFITWGEHDMTSNIVHLTLARTPGAPPGTRGISCFIVPKVLPDTGERNRVSCVGLEEKMGIHASPTCVMSFEEATGYLIGEENRGMAYMFTMMNAARLSVGVEGLSLCERAYQQARGFAAERRQGRRPDAARGESAPIIEHPDVRRMLLTMRSLTEAVRGLCYVTAEALDLSKHLAEGVARTRARERVDLLTPIAKAWGTDVGIEVTSLGVQVHGGYGYIEETGAAQHYRDARITAIYEGTNGIQAIDLVTRKLAIRDGGAMADLVEEARATARQLTEGGEPHLGAALADAVDALSDATAWILEHSEQPDDVLAGATPYLRLAGLTLGGWLLGRSVVALAADREGEFARRKYAAAQFFILELLPQARGLLPAIKAGADLLPLDAA